MIKQTTYVHNGSIECITLEAMHEGKPMFKAYHWDEHLTDDHPLDMYANEQAEQWREAIGQNIARLIVNE